MICVRTTARYTTGRSRLSFAFLVRGIGPFSYEVLYTHATGIGARAYEPQASKHACTSRTSAALIMYVRIDQNGAEGEAVEESFLAARPLSFTSSAWKCFAGAGSGVHRTVEAPMTARAPICFLCFAVSAAAWSAPIYLA
jgi:hypothetical protein